jgi:hypothetical protein
MRFKTREADLLSLTGPLYGPNIALRAQPVSDADEDARWVALVEAGWAVGRSNFSHLLLDVFNILTAYERPDFVAGYLVAAAPSGRWKNPDACEDWFAPQVGAVRQVSLLAYLTARRSGWSALGEEIHRRVRTLPQHIEFTAVAIAPFRPQGSCRSGESDCATGIPPIGNAASHRVANRAFLVAVAGERVESPDDIELSRRFGWGDSLQLDPVDARPAVRGQLLSNAVATCSKLRRQPMLERIRPAVARLSDEFGLDHALASQRVYTDGAELIFD